MDARWGVDAGDLVGQADALLKQRRVRAALDLHEHALALGLDPRDNAGERWMAAMLLGDFARAWTVSDLVLHRTPPRDFNRPDRPFHLRPVWTGAPFDGRRVLVRCYHGLGDIVQFARYLPLLASRARGLTVQAPAAVHGILAGVPGVDALLPLADGLDEPPWDVDLELMELAYAFRTVPETLPAAVPYLSVGTDRIAAQAARLDRRGRVAVGIAWAAGAWDGGHRSVPLELLERLTAVLGVDWVCLQRGPALAEGLGHGALRRAFCDRGARTDDLLDTAAMIRAVDVVISVDTMVAHLAGALGRPVWTLLPFAADWRWMVDRDDSPWYPTMRLFRQPSPGDWGTPVAGIAEALAVLAR